MIVDSTVHSYWTCTLNDASFTEPQLDEFKPPGFEVKISHIHSVLTEHSVVNDTGRLPLQQRLIVCCVLLMLRSKKPINIGSVSIRPSSVLSVINFRYSSYSSKMHIRRNLFFQLADKYADLCPSQRLPGLSPADIVDLCDILASLGVLHVKREKLVRQSKVSLRLAEEDAIFSFAGKPLMDSLLNSKDSLWEPSWSDCAAFDVCPLLKLNPHVLHLLIQDVIFCLNSMVLFLE